MLVEASAFAKRISGSEPAQVAVLRPSGDGIGVGVVASAPLPVSSPAGALERVDGLRLPVQQGDSVGILFRAGEVDLGVRSRPQSGRGGPVVHGARAGPAGRTAGPASSCCSTPSSSPTWTPTGSATSRRTPTAAGSAWTGRTTGSTTSTRATSSTRTSAADAPVRAPRGCGCSTSTGAARRRREPAAAGAARGRLSAAVTLPDDRLHRRRPLPHAPDRRHEREAPGPRVAADGLDDARRRASSTAAGACARR